MEIPCRILKLLLLVFCAAVVAQDTSTNPCEKRKTPGLICEKCELLATCVNLSTGWLIVPLETCDTGNGFYCNLETKSCSNTTGPCYQFGQNQNFGCTDIGLFPDPYNCQKYYMCYVAGNALVSAENACPDDTAYSALNGDCRLSLSDTICRERPYQCNNVGDTNAWPDNPNLFYICKADTNGDKRNLYPALYRCPPNHIFDGQNCVGQSSSNPIPPTSYPSVPTTALPMTSMQPTPSSQPTLLPPTAAPGLQCTALGLQPDPEDCHSYYYCSGLRGTLKHITCPKGTYYNPDMASCAIGNC